MVGTTANQMAEMVLKDVEKTGEACISVVGNKWRFTPESRVKMLEEIAESIQAVIDVIIEEADGCDCEDCERIHPDEISEYLSSNREEL